MGKSKRQKLSVVEEDVIYARGRYCYLVNSKNVIRFAKKQMNKRLRKKAKNELRKIEGIK